MRTQGVSGVERAVTEAYAEATGLTQEAVTAGFDGSPHVPFDSILGLELVVAMEKRFGIAIPEEEETKAKNFKSLRNFSRMVERHVQAAEATS